LFDKFVEQDDDEEEETVDDKHESDTGAADKSDGEGKPSTRQRLKKMFKKRPVSSKKKSDMKSIFKMQKYCVHTLCEHDEVCKVVSGCFNMHSIL
jgi:FtsZ-interacting cell division protein YlmF